MNGNFKMPASRALNIQTPRTTAGPITPLSLNNTAAKRTKSIKSKFITDILCLTFTSASISNKRFKSFQQRPYWIEFLKQRISKKLEHLGIDECDIKDDDFDNFLSKMVDNISCRSKRKKSFNIKAI